MFPTNERRERRSLKGILESRDALRVFDRRDRALVGATLCLRRRGVNDDCLDVPRRLVDEGEDVHHVKKNADNASVDKENSEGRLIQLG